VISTRSVSENAIVFDSWQRVRGGEWSYVTTAKRMRKCEDGNMNNSEEDEESDKRQ